MIWLRAKNKSCAVLLPPLMFPVSPLKLPWTINQHRKQLQRIRWNETDTGEHWDRNVRNTWYVSRSRKSESTLSQKCSSSFEHFFFFFMALNVWRSLRRFHSDAATRHVTHSPLSQFFPPNPRGQSQLKEPHRFTQVPPFRHGLVLQKCLLAEHPRTARECELERSVWSALPHYSIKAEKRVGG